MAQHNKELYAELTYSATPVVEDGLAVSPAGKK